MSATIDKLKTLKKEKALKLFSEGKVTFNKAAELAGLDVWSFADLVKKEGIIWIKDKEAVERDIKAVK